MGRLLNNITNPSDLKKLEVSELPILATEIREEIIKVVSRTGGHLATGLGAVDFTIALHYVLDAPNDVILWDVGHQTYAHKILTGRLKKFPTLRQLGGLSGFPNREESPYDLVTCGHSATSISTALGLALTRDLKQEDRKIAVVIGDASLAGGMAFEALNHAGQLKKNIIVVLNDNELSISPSVGALSRYLNRIITNPIYNKIRRDVERLVKRVPWFGFKAYRAARRLEESLKNLLVPGILFEELGFRYFGPINGHNIIEMVNTLKNIVTLKEPLLVHLITKKGKGYKFAESRPSEFHSAGPFNIDSGMKESKSPGRTFTQAFGEKLVELARKDKRIVAITAAMIDGTGLGKFASNFPKRFYDVGIAEEHAVCLAGGLAISGLRPVVVIYSTFLQRGYDQIIHDVCLQKAPVVFCLDRSGLVGEDGPTHHGVFDIAYLRHIPNMVLAAPKSSEELSRMLEFALRHNGPVAIRYPKGSAGQCNQLPVAEIELGKSELLEEGKDVAIFGLGSMVELTKESAKLLYSKHKISSSVINARFVKPLDGGLIEDISKKTKKFVTLEEGVVDGGFGSAMLEFIEKEDLSGVRLKRIGLPNEFIEHGDRRELFLKYNLTPEGISNIIMNEVMK